MDKKILSLIHRELIQLRNVRLQEAVGLARQREAELRNTLELIARELGADLATETWAVSGDGMFLERVENKEAEKCSK